MGLFLFAARKRDYLAVEVVLQFLFPNFYHCGLIAFSLFSGNYSSHFYFWGGGVFSVKFSY